MHSMKRIWLGLIALSILGAGDCKLYAGSTYTWYGPAGAQGLYLISSFSQTGAPILQPVPLGPATVQISYDPSLYAGVPVPSGATTTDQFPFLFGFSINSTPVSFFGAPLTMEISAPPPGGGPDSILFEANSPQFAGIAFGYVEIFAPNGTLSSSSQLPANLTAFEDYGQGSYGFNVLASPFLPEYFSYGIAGSLGGVPEPSTIVSMSIGMSLSFCFVVLRQRQRRLVAVAGSTRRG